MTVQTDITAVNKDFVRKVGFMIQQMATKYILGIFLNESFKSIIDLYFDVANITCKNTTGIANNAEFTRDLIGYTDSFLICFLSRPENKFNGFTWNEKTHECFGIENAISINDEYECCESCIFNGKILFAWVNSLSCDYNLVRVVVR